MFTIKTCSIFASVVKIYKCVCFPFWIKTFKIYLKLLAAGLVSFSTQPSGEAYRTRHNNTAQHGATTRYNNTAQQHGTIRHNNTAQHGTTTRHNNTAQHGTTTRHNNTPQINSPAI
jgi:hypothetical protein